MAERGSDFYDRDDIFHTYMERRERTHNPNDTIEWPIIEKMLADCLTGQVLDLGCGDGGFSAYCLEHGASHYTGLDGSKNMYNKTNSFENERTTFIHHDIETWSFPVDKMNVVTSRLVFHYIDNLQDIFNKVFQSLKHNGTFIFSVEHPAISAAPPENEGRKTDRTVDHYFETGAREHHWLGGEVTKYHRTIDDYFHLLTSSGFQIVDLRESKPERQYFDTEEEYQRRMRIPLFLLLKARKS